MMRRDRFQVCPVCRVPRVHVPFGTGHRCNHCGRTADPPAWFQLVAAFLLVAAAVCGVALFSRVINGH